MSSLRKQVPITTAGGLAEKAATASPAYFIDRAVWVPARASLGRDDSYFASLFSPPRSAVFFILRLDRLARLVPVVVAPVAQLIEIAAHGERLGAVHRDGLAIDPVATTGDQEYGQILQF